MSLHELNSAGVVVIISGSALVGAIHAILPGHWLPFVLLSRARRWDMGRALAAVAAGGIAHLGTTAALGLLIAFLGAGTFGRIGPAAELAGAGLLAVFGLVLSLRGLRSARGAVAGEEHCPPCGRLPPDETSRTSSKGLAPSSGRIGPHGSGRQHLLEGAVLGARPCAEAVPIFLAAAAYGLTTSILAVLAWVLATLAVLVGIVWLSLLGLGTVRLSLLERYGETAAGLLILLMGLAAVIMAGSA
jgi:nickel/cobalt exporter